MCQDIKWQEGYIITVYNDTIYGMTKKRRSDCYSEVGFKGYEDGKKKIYTAREIVYYKWSNELYRSVFIPLNLLFWQLNIGRYSFVKVIEEGKISLYETKYLPGLSLSGKKFIVKIDSIKPLTVRTKIFSDKIFNRKKLANYLSENTEISDRIRNEKIYFNNLPNIMFNNDKIDLPAFAKKDTIQKIRYGVNMSLLFTPYNYYRYYICPSFVLTYKKHSFFIGPKYDTELDLNFNILKETGIQGGYQINPFHIHKRLNFYLAYDFQIIRNKYESFGNEGGYSDIEQYLGFGFKWNLIDNMYINQSFSLGLIWSLDYYENEINLIKNDRYYTDKGILVKFGIGYDF
ncbi:MAG: hypothetical protein ABII90_11455 [Bacteroidota bacterium]